MINKPANTIAAVTMAFSISASWAQDPAVVFAEKAAEMESMPDMDHSGHGDTPAAADKVPKRTPMNHGNAAAKKNEDMSNMKHGGSGMDHGSMSMQGGSAPPDARDPHAYSDGYDFGPFNLHLMDQHKFSSLLVDNLEAMRTEDKTSVEYDLQVWYGHTYDRAVLKAEGEVDDSRLEEARTELLWGHAVAVFWDTQLGMRYDSGEGSNRSWLAFGVQGLAPYWFNVDVTAYVGEAGRSALRLDAGYNLLLTQKLILQPKVETNFYGKSDIAHGLGSGLSDVSVALRLRYEIRREFAPYIGVEWAGKFGSTADYARDAGQETAEIRAVAGVRFWF